MISRNRELEQENSNLYSQINFLQDERDIVATRLLVSVPNAPSGALAEISMSVRASEQVKHPQWHDRPRHRWRTCPS